VNSIVCKFGGSSVATKENIEKIFNILKLNESRKYVVVSAPGKASGVTTKVTDYLISIVKKSFNSEDYSTDIESVKNRYKEIYIALGLKESRIEEVVSILDKRVKADNSNKDKYRDSIVASGEEMNAILFAEYLSIAGINSKYLSPKDAGLIVTEDFGDAQPLPQSREKMKELRSRKLDSVIVFPGFFGITEKGDIATFSRGGSDLSGALLADAVNASEYENWTDVDGIFSANPNIVTSPDQIVALTYKEMRELSYMGFNVLHEEAVKPVMKKKIPIRLRNTNNVKNEGTLIVSERLPSERDVIGIAGGGMFCAFTLQKFLMNREKGFGRKLLAIFEDMGLSYEHCPSGVDNISVVLDQDQLRPETANTLVRKIEYELDPESIKTEFGIALISVVGEGLLHKVGLLAKATSALSKAGVNIKLVNQGSSEISMIFGIDSTDEEKAVEVLYKEFFSGK